MPTRLEKMITELEAETDREAANIRVNQAEWRKFRRFLHDIKVHDAATYAHSLRVGLYCLRLASYEGEKDLHFPFFGGLGHDYGKCQTSKTLLHNRRFSDNDYERIKSHARAGYEGLKDHFLFTAFIAGLHHKYQHGGYGIDLEADAPRELTEQEVKVIHDTAVVVMICDFYDALVTRRNNKGLLKNFGDVDEQRQVMNKRFPEYPERVEWLMSHRIG
jgi:response regulator RpfG family c-di-GMP phosphodiesterase